MSSRDWEDVFGPDSCSKGDPDTRHAMETIVLSYRALAEILG